MGQQQGNYAKITTTGGTETTVLESSDWSPKVRGASFFTRSSVAGTLRVYFVDRDGVTAGNELQSETLVADTMTLIDFDMSMPRYKVTFQRSGGVDGTCACEVFGY